MPFKLNQARRHRIPRQKHKVLNSLGALLRSRRAYDASLRQRGSLTVWVTDEAVEAWRAEPRTTRGGQRWYSPLAILTALTFRAVFRLALRQTEGLIGSSVGLLRLTLAVPDHSTLCRRAETLEVPRPKLRRGGEPLHLLVDSTGLKGPVTAKLCGMATPYKTRDLLRVPVPISSKIRLRITTRQTRRAAKCQKTRWVPEAQQRTSY